MKSLHLGSGPDPSGDTGMNCDHLDKFEEKHVISILMYVAGNPGCKKTDIYDAATPACRRRSRSSRAWAS